MTIRRLPGAGCHWRELFAHVLIGRSCDHVAMASTAGFPKPRSPTQHPGVAARPGCWGFDPGLQMAGDRLELEM
jgi:hypothetical protein